MDAYPRDNIHFDDAAIIRNAVNFATAQRAFEAASILRQPIEGLDALHRAFLLVAAFEAEMEATEDTLGWLFALREWQPGIAQKSLLALVDRVQIRVRGDYTEEKAIALLDGLSPIDARRILHLPSDEELAAAGVDAPLREQIARALPHMIDGVRRTALKRSEAARTRVDAFNKSKHFLVARPVLKDGKPTVWWPAAKLQDGAFHVKNLHMEASPEVIRAHAGRAVVAQAVLNSLLGLILMFRFREPYETPDWVLDAFRLDVPGAYFREADGEPRSAEGGPTGPGVPPVSPLSAV